MHFSIYAFNQNLLWKLIHDRAPTKDNLERRNCLPLEVNLNCVYCGGEVEIVNHLFLHRQMVFEVRNKITS